MRKHLASRPAPSSDAAARESEDPDAQEPMLRTLGDWYSAAFSAASSCGHRGACSAPRVLRNVSRQAFVISLRSTSPTEQPQAPWCKNARAASLEPITYIDDGDVFFVETYVNMPCRAAVSFTPSCIHCSLVLCATTSSTHRP